MKKGFKIVMIIIACVILAILVFLIVVALYSAPGNAALEKAGIEEKQAVIGEVQFNYAEGPDNGPALVLLHAQMCDWNSYHKVLPELSRYYHVFAIDYPGHGKTVVPSGYIMSAENIGTDLGRFIDVIIEEAVYVTGNSSGGLLSVWLAANRSDIIKGAILEDPPLFGSEIDEIEGTVAYRAFAQSKKAVEADYEGNYLDYFINHSTAFFQNNMGAGSQKAVRLMVDYYRIFHPKGPVNLAFLPSSAQEMLRGLSMYDPHFGAAFADGSWNKSFDHAEALASITCPVLLIHANYDYTDDGILNGAMSTEMAEKAMSLLSDGTFLRIDAGHVTHLEVPEKFMEAIIGFATE